MMKVVEDKFLSGTSLALSHMNDIVIFLRCTIYIDYVKDNFENKMTFDLLPKKITSLKMKEW